MTNGFADGITLLDPRWNIGGAAVHRFVGMKYGVTGPLATKRYVQAKKQLHKMMLQVPHTYPGGAYKKPLAFLFLTLKPDACTTKISPRLFVVSTSLVSDHLCSITVLNFFVPQEPFCRQASVA